VSLSRS